MVAALILERVDCGFYHCARSMYATDKTGERRWHTAIPLAIAGVVCLLLASTHLFQTATVPDILGGGCMFAYYPAFWFIPTLFLTEAHAAACFGLINSIGYMADWL